MRTPWDYLNEAMIVLNSPSIYHLSRHLGLSRTSVHNWIKGRTVPDEKHLMALAEIIDADPRIALLERHCWQSAIARDKKRLTLYMQILKVLTGDLPKLPDAYDYEMKSQYRFRTPESLVDT